MQTPRTAQLPPFFTQVIGSLPRPQAVRDLVAARGAMDPGRFREAMDDAVRFAIRVQQQASIDVVSDGEWRRSQYVDEYLDRTGGFERVWRYEHAGEVKYHRVAVRRIENTAPVFSEDARFLALHARQCTKFALPSPFLIAMRYWHQDFSRGAYPTWRHLMEHLAEILAGEARALAEAGVDIVQIDDPALTYFCDRRLMAGETSHDERLRREWDPASQIPDAVAAINRVAEGLPVPVHLHCCHSVYKRRSDVAGDYQPLLPRLAGLRVDRVNLEFAYAGTGEVGDLALLPPHLGVGMGVIDVRTERLQSVDEVVALGEAGARAIGAARIALNPDCGFAPNSGEPPGIDEAYAKLRVLAEAAARLRAACFSTGTVT